MTNFVVFNELSLPLDDNLWQQQLKQYLQLLSELSNCGISQVRIDQPFKNYPLFTRSKSLQAFFADLSRDWQSRLKSMLINQTASYRSPLIEIDEQPQHEQWLVNSEYRYLGEVNHGGFACAHIWQSAAISFNTQPAWQQTQIILEKIAIDDEITDTPQSVSVAHLSDFSHVGFHKAHLLSLVHAPQSIQELLEFCELLNDTLIHKLIFTEAASAQLHEVYPQNQRLLQRLYEVVKSVKTDPDEGIGKPERLKNNLTS